MKRLELFVLDFPLSEHLTNDEGEIPIYIKALNSFLESDLEAHCACLVFRHVIGAVEIQLNGDGSMRVIWGDQKYPNAISLFVGSAIEEHFPSEAVLSGVEDIFIRELGDPNICFFYRVVSEVVRDGSSINDFLCDVHDIKLG